MAKRMCEKNAGNLSVDVTEHLSLSAAQLKAVPVRLAARLLPEFAGRSYLVTGIGTRYRDIQSLSAECLCILRISRDAIDEIGRTFPSKD